ncbi:thiamine phosphate synthase [Temperatibacter marinus]|uniref:Thiamine phosphate synthase n=1 Tax=Temperatibacter marinus TaxID=1456591 RepID=A0AA52EJF5_9PROT|nr:thiamine phosphate synthase [Temperatibacter marinus]WND03642.1 thiamine phosphate synthase [Temperatibacter marinus]
MTDEKRTGPTEFIIPELPKNTVILYREYEKINRAEEASKLQYLSLSAGCRFFVAGDIPLARSLNAEGVHIPHWLLETVKQDDLLGLKTTVACHDQQALHRAEELKLTMALVSPVFPTSSHPGAPVLGIDMLTNLSANAKIELAALGGITKDTAPLLKNLSLSAIAGVSAFV